MGTPLGQGARRTGACAHACAQACIQGPVCLTQPGADVCVGSCGPTLSCPRPARAAAQEPGPFQSPVPGSCASPRPSPPTRGHPGHESQQSPSPTSLRPRGKGMRGTRECWTSRENPEDPARTGDAPVCILTLQHPPSPWGGGTPLPSCPLAATSPCQCHPLTPTSQGRLGTMGSWPAERGDLSPAAPGASGLPEGLTPAPTARAQDGSHRTGISLATSPPSARRAGLAPVWCGHVPALARDGRYGHRALPGLPGQGWLQHRTQCSGTRAPGLMSMPQGQTRRQSP